MFTLSLPQKAALIVLALVIAFVAGRFSSPAMKQTKTTEKQVTDEKVNENVQQDVTTDTKQTKMPNGVVITETITKRETNKQIKKDIDQRTDITSSTTITNRPDWRVGAIYDPAIPHFQDTNYGVMIEKRMFSEVYLGVEAKTDKTIGLVLTLGF